MMNLSRREFLAASAIAAAMAKGAAAAPRRRVGANEKITLGFIGQGGMGSGLLKIFKGFGDVEVAAVCDVYEPHRLKAKETAGGKAQEYKDFREVLDRKDVDAVVIATPDHWHAIPTILACQADKDVYCEKPLSFRIAEGRAMVEAAAKHRRVTQMGNLIHATENYHRVVEVVRSGILGTIAKTRVWMAADRSGLGKPADSDPPAGLDWDFWLGPAPKRAFNTNRFLFHWRYFWDTGGGILMDFCCHIVDLVHWAMEVDAPETACATGGRYALDDNAEVPDTLEVAYHYAKGPRGFDMVWSQTDFNAHGLEGMGLGIMFQGTEGTLVADYGGYRIIPAKGKELHDKDVPRTLPRSVGHHREWLDAIKSRDECSCRFAYGHRLSSVGHLGNIALWTGEKLRWDAKAERVTNHDEANRHLARLEERAPWTLPKV
ncbi:MAG TPA: Gfo/Idh/MocA family oxidoreductase [Isosphaeraceae bacterium]|jgi:predicted dehydrogenase|nr:Gfo/Idh/MocA family oxidoreductase [Isosphaeraceae bacterium]